MFFFDGSSIRAAGPKPVIPTNVFRLSQTFTYGFSGVPQIVFYFPGVGTRADSMSAVTGQGFDQIAMDAYIDLASNYQPGDRIYLFGFSRGAAAAAALSELISDPGLTSRDGLHVFPEIWRYLILDRNKEAERERLRNRLSGLLWDDPPPEIEFLGAFDTVEGSSWDIAKLFTTVRIRDLAVPVRVKAAVQVLAIDDDRNPSFSPFLWKANSQLAEKVEQIWIPGVHADVGGMSDGTFLGNLALLTMIERIKSHCPEVELDDVYVDKPLRDLRDRSKLQISNERPGLLRKLLRKNPRNMGGHVGECVHPIVDMLYGKTFKIKGRSSVYEPHNYVRDALPVCQTEHLELFKEACARAIGSPS
jgi:uncharacterized protein (DUF2235 family)